MRQDGVCFLKLFRTIWVIGLVSMGWGVGVYAQTRSAGPSFAVSLPISGHAKAITGRLFLTISQTKDPEPRLQSHWFNSPEFLAVDVDQWKGGQPTVLDSQVMGYPFRSLKDVPPGDYFVQAYLQIYTEYHRSDGHVVWAMDQWDGQDLGESAGDLYSAVKKVHLDAAQTGAIELSLEKTVPPSPPPPDTEWVKHIKIKSEILSRFWGRPIYLGAVVLLPRGYASHPERQYPVLYQQQIVFGPGTPFDFTTVKEPESESDRRERKDCGYETGYEFSQSWQSDHFPRFVAVHLQHPTPYAALTAATNSANNGPYQDALITELIPYIENQFRIVKEPYARMLVGKNAGGFDALNLQLSHPAFFGGAWIFYPWPIDLRRYFSMNIYDDKNAYEVGPANIPEEYRNPWSKPEERMVGRTREGQPFVTMREMGYHDLVMAEKWPGGEMGWDDAALGPVAENGYPKPLWNRKTGEIDGEVARYWREHGDLAYYAKEHWSTIGAQLVGKLHFYVGDVDDFYRNNAVYLFQDFLRTAQPDFGGSFQFGWRKGKDWQPMTNAELVKSIADYISRIAPAGSIQKWKDD